LATDQIPRDGFALRKMMAGAPTLGRPLPNWHFSDIAPLADDRFAPEAAIRALANTAVAA